MELQNYKEGGGWGDVFNSTIEFTVGRDRPRQLRTMTTFIETKLE